MKKTKLTKCKRGGLGNKGFAVSGILYPILILTLFLIVQILTMMASRKAVLDKNKQQLLDSVNRSNQIYTNEELSILLSSQQEQIKSLTQENETLKSKLDTTNNTLSTLSTNVSNNYASKSYLSSQLKTFIPKRSCYNGSGNTCSIDFGTTSSSALCWIGPPTGGAAAVDSNTGIYYVGWHSPNGENMIRTKIIIDNGNGLKSVSVNSAVVTFTSKYPAAVTVRCYNF